MTNVSRKMVTVTNNQKFVDGIIEMTHTFDGLVVN